MPRDTTPEALAVQFEAYRRLGEAGRYRLMLQICDWGRRITASGIRHRHPEYTEEQVRLAVVRLTLGPELFAKVYPGVEITP